MLWFLAMHIATLLFWCAALLYLPVVLLQNQRSRSAQASLKLQSTQSFDVPMPRFLYTHITTPAALAAIITGTAVFLLDRNASVWLIIKLSLVTALVICHALTGVLVLRAENRPKARLQGWCWLSLGVQCLLMTAIVAVVLAKPTVELPL